MARSNDTPMKKSPPDPPRDAAPPPRTFDRLAERLAQKAQVDAIRPHPLRPRLFSSGSIGAHPRRAAR